MAAKPEKALLDIGGREVTISNPGKVYFPQAGVTKLEVAQYYLAIAEGALRGAGGRPNVLVRYVDGIAEAPFWQKRAPEGRPAWLEVVTLSFPSGRTAEEIVPREPAALVWMVNLGCLELHPHPVRADDLEHPDELRVDLDPVPGVEWAQLRETAQVVRAVLADVGLTGWPKTSGSRGLHVNVRLHRRWTCVQVRRAALALAREVERRAPTLATSKWWKEERQGVFVDFNQNAKDRTVASAYSVRPTPDARVSTPLAWDEVRGCRPERFTLATVAHRFADLGDPWEGIDAAGGSLEPLLELARRLGPAEKPPKGSGGRRLSMPLIEIARARTRPEAMAGLERWKARHPDAVARLEAADVLVDGMRGRSSVWYRIRVNLQHVPEDRRPPQEPLEVDYDPWAGFTP